MRDDCLDVTICVPLDIDPTPVIEQVATAAGRQVRVHFHPDLLPPQRFPADHKGEPDYRRSDTDELAWQRLLAETDIALGFPGDSPAGLQTLIQAAPRLKWVQGTAAGTGEQAIGAGLGAETSARLTITSAAGLHAVPLAEFALFGLLALAKDLDVLQQASADRQWLPRWPMRLLAGSHVLVVGMGGIGREVARLCAAFGATVTGVRRSAGGQVPPGIDRVVGLDDLDGILPSADAVVLTLPGTEHTRHLFDGARLSLLAAHAVLVNVGRGSVLDTGALIDALDARTLRGAVLDVTDVEPLPAESALWGRSNVIISPHTAALTTDEDARIVALFADNLRSFLAAEPLRNTIDLAAGY
jgi:phosphoglycerate dehydrogenase-like enzyme